MPRRSPLLVPTANPITGGRTLLRLATAGSVDDGKSTLVGRLLFNTNPCSPIRLITLSG